MEFDLTAGANATPTAGTSGNLSETEDPALTVRFLITVPHASGDIPDWIVPLELSDDWHRFAQGSHHALDRGAASLARETAKHLNGDVVAAECSRLFVDMNRPLEDGTAITTEINGEALRFNTAILPGDLAARRSAHRRFHTRVSASLAAKTTATAMFLVDQHSFDRFGPSVTARDVDIGICAPGDADFAHAVLAALEARTVERSAGQSPDPEARRLNVRLDQPYSATHPGAYVVRRHGPSTSGAVVIEVCDDLLSKSEHIAAIAALLAEALSEAAASHPLLPRYEGEHA